jgi:hypothetical protein
MVLGGSKQRRGRKNKGIVSQHEKLRKSRIHYIYKTRGMTPEWKKAKLADKSFDGYIKELKVEREKISWFGFRYNTMETMGGLQLSKAGEKNVTPTWNKTFVSWLDEK